ncbi:hypothetical protein [Maledivibacter halophilus]|uniref:Uncharacterized protein n=1 Tax=Maledivibacter halophilus TaxID=36842 RepID=A0A1T5L364_9FIRM|nr:hypothetical protein [Maledivibacter halophilus]SKC70383.1 hypothetical protein SAMN02194393_02429 [Maledivibacter halophilus]
MKPEKVVKKRVALILLIGIFLLLGIFMYNQWKFLRDMIEEKNGDMANRYWHQNQCLETIEEIAAEIIISNRISKKTLNDIKYLNKRYLELKIHKEYYQPKNYLYGDLKNKISDNLLNRFIHETNDFFEEIYDNNIKLTDKNLQYIKNLHSKTKELNSIVDKYEFSIRQEYENLFYSENFANSINEMDRCIDINWFKKLEYEREDREEKKLKNLKPEDIFGEKVFSENEAREVAQEFLGDFDTVKRRTGSGESRYDDDKMFEHIDFDTIKEYEVEISVLGGKINRIFDKEWDDLLEEQGKSFDESQINISKEESINKLIKFLDERNIKDLEVIEVDEYGPELKVRFVKDTGRYLNMAAEIECIVDLTRKGRLLELSLEDYWQGLAFDDSRYDQALTGYDKAKKVLGSKITVTEENLVGEGTREQSLDFYWRFATRYDGEEYYIYVNVETGEEDIKKINK